MGFLSQQHQRLTVARVAERHHLRRRCLSLAGLCLALPQLSLAIVGAQEKEGNRVSKKRKGGLPLHPLPLPPVASPRCRRQQGGSAAREKVKEREREEEKENERERK